MSAHLPLLTLRSVPSSALVTFYCGGRQAVARAGTLKARHYGWLDVEEHDGAFSRQVPPSFFALFELLQEGAAFSESKRSNEPAEVAA